MRVSWKLPAGFKGAGSFAVVSLQAKGSDRWLHVDSHRPANWMTQMRLRCAALAVPEGKEGGECVVKNVDPGVSYLAKVRLGNQAGWGCDSEASKGLKRAGGCGWYKQASTRPVYTTVSGSILSRFDFVSHLSRGVKQNRTWTKSNLTL